MLHRGYGSDELVKALLIDGGELASSHLWRCPAFRRRRHLVYSTHQHVKEHRQRQKIHKASLLRI